MKCFFKGDDFCAYKTNEGLFVICGYKKDIHNAFSGLCFYIDEVEIAFKEFKSDYKDAFSDNNDKEEADCCLVWSDKYDTFTIILFNKEKIEQIIKLVEVKKQLLISNFNGDKKFVLKIKQ